MKTASSPFRRLPHATRLPCAGVAVALHKILLVLVRLLAAVLLLAVVLRLLLLLRVVNLLNHERLPRMRRASRLNGGGEGRVRRPEAAPLAVGIRLEDGQDVSASLRPIASANAVRAASEANARPTNLSSRTGSAPSAAAVSADKGQPVPSRPSLRSSLFCCAIFIAVDLLNI